MRLKICSNVMIILVVLSIAFISTVSAASVAQKRQSVRDMADRTLTRLYELRPGSKAAIESAVGYAVFSNYGLKIFVLGGGRGNGLAVNNNTDQEIFMKMAQVDIGFGLGAKKFSHIFVFESERALERFINQGWEFGGQATVAATDGVKGDSFQGAVSVSPEVWMYQLTEKGLALEITGKGTRYYKDSDLN